MASCPICRADHIGSLLRPARLRGAYRELNAGKIDQAAFEATLNDSIREAIRMQETAGLGTVTDGEFRRRSWFAGFVDAVDGLEHRDTEFQFVEDGAPVITVPVPHTYGPIRRVRGIATEEFVFARDNATTMAKVTLPAPSVIHFHRGPDGIDRKVYPDEDQWWDDLIAVYQQEIRALAALGCKYLQIDEVPIALLCDPNIQSKIARWGWNWETLLDRYVDANTRMLVGKPEGMAVGMHLCRGNYRGHFIGSGGYEPVAEKLFHQPVDQFLLEYDSDRAGDFRPLRHVPQDKSVVLGLISSKTADMESEKSLAARVEEAARFIPMDRLAISPQCGFGTTVGGAPMDETTQQRKLELVSRMARTIWG